MIRQVYYTYGGDGGRFRYTTSALRAFTVTNFREYPYNKILYVYIYKCIYMRVREHVIILDLYMNRTL